MLCFLFGHGLPSTTRDITVAMTMDRFQCRRCCHFIEWKSMPKPVQAMRAEYLHRISTPNI